MAEISASFGAFVSVKGCSDKMAAGISVKQAFFAPAIRTEPCSGRPPQIVIESIQSSLFRSLPAA